MRDIVSIHIDPNQSDSIVTKHVWIPKSKEEEKGRREKHEKGNQNRKYAQDRTLSKAGGVYTLSFTTDDLAS